MANPICGIDGCERKHNARGFCLPHYKRWRKYGDPEGAAPRRTECAVEGCPNPWRCRDWCYMHYQRIQRTGSTELSRERPVCTVEGCTNYRQSRGWCPKHLTRWRRHGDPTARLAGEVIDGCRVCPRCETDKPVAEYSPGNAFCKVCVAAYARSATGAATRKRWAEQNADRVREIARLHAHLRRTRLSTSGVRITLEDLASRMAFFGNRCWMCLGPFEHIDHVKPLSKGGPHLLSNMRPSCRSCNQSKSGRWQGVAGLSSLAR